MATVQPVINWNNFAAYLVRAAQTPIICVGKKLQHLRDDLYMIPRERKDCATLMRDERGARQKMANITRKRRLDLLRNLVETYDARSFNELNLALTYDERDDIYGEYGPQWKETAEHCISNYTVKILIEQQTSRFEDHIRTNSHNRDCQHPKNTLDGEDWLDLLLHVNRINKQDFLCNLTKIMNKQIDRKNAFVIEGPTTTGKTLFVKLIAESYIYGTVQRSGDHSQFFLMNLLNKALALMEEPRITQLTVNDFKELLGGNAFDIHVKHQKDERLTRLPVLITTNNDLTYYVLGEYDIYMTWTTLERLRLRQLLIRNATKLPSRKFYLDNIYQLSHANIEVPPYTGDRINFLETRRRQYRRPDPIVELPETTENSASETPTRPSTSTIKPEEQETKPTTTTGHTSTTEEHKLTTTTKTPEEVSIMETKRQRLDTKQEDESYGSNLAVAKHAESLFGIHYYKTDITVTRKQHLTLAQYKPAGTGITQYYITCLPYQIPILDN
ncbi:non-capsid protein NS-1 [Clonorchis sinensis]|uniref:Non-capsid protein NS-1 n=1 Tax=Clonorchis sinensis TaxID=79923 RepID=H2KNU7_CLOSI|nr:non-capsid protein NS-1 [Clonorchis sinensis]